MACSKTPPFKQIKLANIKGDIVLGMLTLEAIRPGTVRKADLDVRYLLATACVRHTFQMLKISKVKHQQCFDACVAKVLNTDLLLTMSFSAWKGQAELNRLLTSLDTHSKANNIAYMIEAPWVVAIIILRDIREADPAGAELMGRILRQYEIRELAAVSIEAYGDLRLYDTTFRIIKYESYSTPKVIFGLKCSTVYCLPTPYFPLLAEYRENLPQAIADDEDAVIPIGGLKPNNPHIVKRQNSVMRCDVLTIWGDTLAQVGDWKHDQASLETPVKMMLHEPIFRVLPHEMKKTMAIWCQKHWPAFFSTILDQWFVDDAYWEWEEEFEGPLALGTHAKGNYYDNLVFEGAKAMQDQVDGDTIKAICGGIDGIVLRQIRSLVDKKALSQHCDRMIKLESKDISYKETPERRQNRDETIKMFRRIKAQVVKDTKEICTIELKGLEDRSLQYEHDQARHTRKVKPYIEQGFWLRLGSGLRALWAGINPRWIWDVVDGAGRAETTYEADQKAIWL
ncbi:hypothetical protein G7046_g2307 [Stylonectria norvegica]|nr:hypothetical protein G7046_g2307 [Stylonectria norvegica]